MTNSATMQQYLDEVEEVRQGCESLSKIVNSIAKGNQAVLDGFNKALDAAIVKCNTSSSLIKIYGETLTSSSEELMEMSANATKQNYITTLAFALHSLRIPDILEIMLKSQDY